MVCCQTSGVPRIIRAMHDTTRPFPFFFRHPGSEEPSRRKGMTGLGARRGEQHGSRNEGYMMGLVYRVIYLTGANGVASAVLTLGHAASKKECLRRNLGPDRVSRK